MSDLIDRQAAIGIASGYCHPANIAKELAKLPSAQPERKKGEWVKNEHESAKHVEAIYFCSSCHNFEAWGETERYNFCPNCGADMRGEE